MSSDAGHSRCPPADYSAGGRAQSGLRPGQDRGPLRASRSGRRNWRRKRRRHAPSRSRRPTRGSRQGEAGSDPPVAAGGFVVLNACGSAGAPAGTRSAAGSIRDRACDPAGSCPDAGTGTAGSLQELTELGEVVGPRLLCDRRRPAAVGARGIDGSGTQRLRSIRRCSRAGVRVERCHDVSLTERILLGREGRFGVPNSAAAVHARATGGQVPQDPGPRVVPEQPDAVRVRRNADDRHWPDVDPIEVLRVALVDQRRRIADDRALGLLLAAESASGLAASEMGRTGPAVACRYPSRAAGRACSVRGPGPASDRSGWPSSPPRSTPRSGSRSIPIPRSTCGQPSAGPGSTSTAPGRG